MKKICTLVVLMITVLAAQAQTADEVINKYLAAAGGKEKLQSVTSLQYVQKLNLTTPMGAMDISLAYIKVENKLFRINTSSELLGSGFSLVTDTSGWIYIPASPFTGTEATLQKLKPEEQKSLQSQMACDGYFPELVNYAAKGYTAELAGEAKSGGKACYKIKLKKDKDERIYFIDKQTGLVNSMTVKGAAVAAMTGMGNSGMGGGGRVDKMEATFAFSNYQDVSGIKFPGKVSTEIQWGTLESELTGIKVNQPVDVKWYRPQ